MFFKMLKNDLKQHKGLNIILFIFIVCSSVISVVAANLMYMEMQGRKQTDEITNVANVTVDASVGMGHFEEKKDDLNNWIQSSDLVQDGEIKEYIRLIDDEVSINGRYTSEDGFPEHKTFNLSTMSKKINLIYNDSDNPFRLDTGEIAISMDMAKMACVKRGDTIRITTQMGSVYEFKIAEIYKRPSVDQNEELLISDVDFEMLKSEYPYRFYRLLLNVQNINFKNRIGDELRDQNMVKSCNSWAYTPGIDGNYTVVVAISYFLVIMSVVVILIMLITIRFMMLAAIKQEEKEIGMMRAIGVDSWRYRWMFAATYLVFAIVGGIIGIVAGVPLSRYAICQFCQDLIVKDHNMVIYIALAVSIFLIIMIILFAALMMRRINKISVIETIHGYCGGERFGKLTRINLYNSKKQKVPTFLAFGNVINEFKKYIFLIITYMLAVIVLLTAFYVKSSLLSKDYSKNFLMLNYDFEFEMYGDLADYYFQKGGYYEGAYKLMVEDANKAGVPVKFRYMKITYADIIRGDKDDIPINFLSGDTYNKLIPLRKGGTLPVKSNEAIMSYFTAKNEGIKLGDTITIELKEYDDDSIGTHKVQRDFIITGFFDIMENNSAAVIVGKEYQGAEHNNTYITDLWLDAPESEKAAYIDKLRDLFGDEYIKDFDETVKDGFSYINVYIDALKVFLSVMIAFILYLNTLLYSTVDLARETPSVAVLKCVGFSDKDIRKWHMIRMLIILILGFIAAYILEETVINLVASKAFEIFGITGFHFVPAAIDKYVIIPVIIFTIVLVALRICLRKVKHINIWNIREE
ncbi:MAG: ABC transporter permease [Eubacterium sp.]|nr:ABC transporter permease [Eubacterium sp.]